MGHRSQERKKLLDLIRNLQATSMAGFEYPARVWSTLPREKVFMVIWNLASAGLPQLLYFHEFCELFDITSL